MSEQTFAVVTEDERLSWEINEFSVGYVCIQEDGIYQVHLIENVPVWAKIGSRPPRTRPPFNPPPTREN